MCFGIAFGIYNLPIEKIYKLKLHTIMDMIKLTGINKIYRTDEIETQALENVNLEVEKGNSLALWDLLDVENLLC